MAFLSTLPVLVKVSLAFGIILTANRLRVHLSLALFFGALALGLMMGLGVTEILTGLWVGISDRLLIYLLFIVALILVLSRLMNESGRLNRIVESFQAITGNVGLAAGVMPALIGLLPMPGGALFSAPMVASASRDAEIGPEVKTAVNYWFRHIWEYWWPLYPGVILAVSLLGVKSWHFVLVQFPLTLMAVFAGYVFLLKNIRATSNGPENGMNSSEKWKRFFKEIFPVILVILGIPAVTLFEIATGVNLPKLSAVFIGLGMCLLWVVAFSRMPARQVFDAAFSKSILPMLFLIIGIMAFKGMLTHSEAVAQIHDELKLYGIPTLLVIIIVPFISGLITGIAVAFVGASFPLVVPLIASYQGLDYLAYASLAYAFGFMGVMLSPVHLCLLVSKDYFHAGLAKSYKLVVKPAALFMVFVFLYFGILRIIGN